MKEKTQGKIQKLKGNPSFDRPLKNHQADMLLGKKVYYQALTSVASCST
jgi:predicted phage gp36 major capsid-like protein